MYTSPNVVQMLESVLGALSRDVLPHVTDPAARMNAEMCLAVLQWSCRLVPIEQQLIAQEIGEMRALLASVGELMETESSSEGMRIRDRGEQARGRTPPSVPGPYQTLLTEHRTLSEALVPTLDDLHALVGQGHDLSREGLTMVRSHLAQRATRDLHAYLGAPGGEAMVGRS